MKLLAALLLSQIWSLTPEPIPVLDWSLDSQTREEVISSTVSVDAPATPERTEKPLLQIWSQPTGCPPCERLKSDIKSGRFFGFDLQYMTGSPPGRRGYPTILSGGEYSSGWPVKDEDRLAKIRQLKEAAGIKSEVMPQVATIKEILTVQPLSMQWDIQGNWSPTESETREHLENDHGINTDGMTHQQMLDAHDAAHSPKQYAIKSKPVQIAYCPTGSCPPQFSSRKHSRRNRR